MKLTVYKGFDSLFLKSIEGKPLLENEVIAKKDVLSFDRKYRKQLEMALISLDDNDSVWATYEEYTLIKNRVSDAIEEDGLKLALYRNNLYPDYYPIEFDVSPELAFEIDNAINDDRNREVSEECQRYLAIYNSLVTVDGLFFGSFYNFEYDTEDGIVPQDFYPQNLVVTDSAENSEYNIFLNEDVENYLRDLVRIENEQPKIIGLSSTNGDISNRIQKSLQAYCLYKDIQLVRYRERVPEEDTLRDELIDIAKNEIGISEFKDFRKIRFYKNPDVSKEVVEISQSQIIYEIIHQAENAYDDDNGNAFRDIFITASTGAGKSVMFQIPAVYLAKKYQKLTIIIEPVKALMQDQKEKLNKAGYNRVEAFNSDLITQVEKEAVLQRIKDGEVDLLYLSPETLLSYSIETIVGDREIGLVIVDEAHIVTTWGVGFRPDYWYLGGYLNRLRNQIKTAKGKERKVYHFPICAFTATAINGGIDDSVSDTVISLYMENPIKYLGYVRRDDINFEIVHRGEYKKLPKAEYEAEKCSALDERLKKWLSNNEKTIAYFPYANQVNQASKGMLGFTGITLDKRIGTYTGANINEMSTEAFNEAKRQVFDGFRDGSTPIIMATKAFGMGVDVNDVQNVYHYAVSGNLSDYVQEIGRAARKEGVQGTAITDFMYNDMTFMKVLFGMSQIKQYQIKKVLEGIYGTYKNKKGARNFLISPESFTYIFSGKDEQAKINKLKTSLLMIEKDLGDKYNFKVIISRPQSVFTKAFICVDRNHQDEVINSKYGKYMHFVAKGRFNERQIDGTTLSDAGDVYSLNLKEIWEDYYPNISFPQFKYWYFNANSQAKDKVEIMPSIRPFIAPRQKVSVEARGELILSELREKILQDFEYIADTLYTNFRGKHFKLDEFAKLLVEKYGKAEATIIANSLFALVDPNGKCVKHRGNDSTGRLTYTLANGNFKEFMRKSIIKSKIMADISREKDASSYSGYISLVNDDTSNTALKLLSIFNYITYEVVGGSEPEIFIRLNDPNKVRSIVMGNTRYSNNYVTKARQKHDRDVEIMVRFFNGLNTDEERWNYIEEYFLGQDVLAGVEMTQEKKIKMSRSVDKEHSYPTNMFKTWAEIESFFDEGDWSVLRKLDELGISLPQYLETAIKHSDEGGDILMSWPSKDTLICQQETADRTIDYFERKGWHAYRIYEIDYEKIKGELS